MTADNVTDRLLPKDIYGGTFSADQFAALPRPACPVCGTPIGLDRLDVTLNAAQLAREGRRYMVGRWRCPRECNPNTGLRLHGNHVIASSMAGEIRFFCNCGFDELVDPDQIAALYAAHPNGEYA